MEALVHLLGDWGSISRRCQNPEAEATAEKARSLLNTIVSCILGQATLTWPLIDGTGVLRLVNGQVRYVLIDSKLLVTVSHVASFVLTESSDLLKLAHV